VTSKAWLYKVSEVRCDQQAGLRVGRAVHSAVMWGGGAYALDLEFSFRASFSPSRHPDGGQAKLMEMSCGFSVGNPRRSDPR